MSSTSGVIRVFRGCRAPFAQANPATPVSSTAAASPESIPKPPSYGQRSTQKPKIPLSPISMEKRAATFSRIMTVSPALATFLGSPEASRTEALKMVWDYIKTNRLQNPVNRGEIFCDEKLKKLFGGKERVGTLEVNSPLCEV